MKKFLEIIRSSFTSTNGKESSTRISAYLILGGIILIVLTAVAIEITAAIMAFIAGEGYLLSNEFLIVLGSLLTHHLALLGINKNYETKYNINKTNKTSSMGGDTLTDPPADSQQPADPTPPDVSNVG